MKRTLIGFVVVMTIVMTTAPVAMADNGSEAVCAPKASWPGGPGYQGVTCTYDWIDISATGTELQLQDDDYDGPFALGFDFSLYDFTSNQVWISSNGYLSFSNGHSSNANQCPILNYDSQVYLVAPLWDDLDPGDTQDPIYYQAFDQCPVGSGKCFVVQWQDICHYPGGEQCQSAGTFQAIVYEGGGVIMQFQDAGDEAGSSSTTGISGSLVEEDHSLTYACDEEDSLSDQLCLEFVPTGGLFSYQVAGIAHAAGAQGTAWRSSLAVTNRSGKGTGMEFTLYEASGETTASAIIEDGEILEWDDVIQSLFGLSRDAAGSVRVVSNVPLTMTARTYNQGDDGTFGQFLPALMTGTGLPPSYVGLLPHLKSNADYRTNIGFLNLSDVPCTVRYQLHRQDGSGIALAEEVTVPPYGWKQENRVFRGLGNQAIAYATVDLTYGTCRAWAYASVVDENTGDPTTIPLVWED